MSVELRNSLIVEIRLLCSSVCVRYILHLYAVGGSIDAEAKIRLEKCGQFFGVL